MKAINDDDIQYLLSDPVNAKDLLLRNFPLFVKVFHYYMERSQFIFMPFHYEICNKLMSYVYGINEKQNLYIGISPRSGKSKLSIYFMAYSYAINPFSNFIYTSYSNSLCVKHSKMIRNIVDSELFQTLFRMPIDPTTSASDLWRIKGGGEFRAVAMGGAITGFGAGTFADEFGGAVVVDDFLKADDYKSAAEKQNVIDIFENTLRSRKNRPAKDPTIIIAQRLAKGDLIDYIKEKYPDEWDFFVIPALNEETGESFWEERFPAQMLMQMKNENPFLYYSQYQQEPIAIGGSVFKHEWWRYYKDINDTQYKRIFITADTANKTKEWNDYTAIGVWGLTIQNRLRLLDLVHTKMEMPELQSTMVALWEKWKMGIGRTRCTAIYIEDKASGTQVIQTLKRQGGLPIMALIPDKDKLERALDCVPQVAAGNVELPENENNQITREFLSELDAFSADMTHTHDDLCFVAGTKIATPYGDKNIEDIKVGDAIITPVGICRCINCGLTGYKKTIKRFGLEATPNHKVFYNNSFERIDRLTYADKCSMLSLKELIKWKYKKILYSMESDINLWGRESIISLNQIQTKEESVRKDFMWRFGNFIRERKFQRAISFTTKTTTALITTFLTWSAYHVSNTLKCTKKTECSGINLKNVKNILKKLDIWHLIGINHQKDLNGTEKMQKNNKNHLAQKFVIGVKKNIQQKDPTRDFVQSHVIANMHQSVQEEKAVYNLTVDNAHCYYANGILVSNCDMFTYACNTAYSQRGYF